MSIFPVNTISILDNIYTKFFGHQIGSNAKKLFNYLTWSFIGGLFSAIIMFIFTTTIGNKLGPFQFGKYNSIISLGTTFSLLILLGTNIGLTRFASDSDNETSKNRYFWASIIISTINLAIVFAIGFLTSKLWLGKISLQKSDLILSLIAGIFIAYKSLSDSILKSFLLFKAQSVAKIVESTLVLLFLLVPLFLKISFDYQYLIHILILSYLSFFLMSFTTGKLPLKHLNFPRKEIKTLANYNKILLLSLIGSVLLGFEKFTIGHFMGLEKLGIFSAYYAVSQSILSTLTIIFMNAYWPYLIQEKSNFYSSIIKIKKILFQLSPVWLFSIYAAVNLFILLFGSAYQHSNLYSLIFTFSSYLNICWSILAYILLINHAKRISVISTIIPFTFIIMIVITKNIAFYVISQIAIYLAAIFYANKQIKSDYMQHKVQNDL